MIRRRQIASRCAGDTASDGFAQLVMIYSSHQAGESSVTPATYVSVAEELKE
jgi:hypothetical protein